MTPECLSREDLPGPDSSVRSPAGQLTSQSAPGTPGHPYIPTGPPTQKGRLIYQIGVVTNGASGDVQREDKYMPGNIVEEQSLSPAGQYSPAPVVSVYNYSGNYGGPDAGVGVNKRIHEDPDSPGSPAPLAIVESREPSEYSGQKRQRINDSDEH